MTYVQLFSCWLYGLTASTKVEIIAKIIGIDTLVCFEVISDNYYPQIKTVVVKRLEHEGKNHCTQGCLVEYILYRLPEVDTHSCI